jgi:hypothetical protein
MESGAKGCEVPALLTEVLSSSDWVNVAHVLIGHSVFARSL